ncbi:LysR family transcriptional regulator [Paraburkholderia sp. Ac-20340]|uniref:LysR substrate-binding domain-containing protein n=1 Tax=Paraburkholderia sp. Ac-20340 TaxID=2703888 RepID=UPI0019820AD6|nr:LysR family transcriptional regulator [Paraburkholderia sp. Ac-20340]MBN3857279.1 LysR family transcriptional regulator [Paraburkholderia sp. Ac-20340]
MELRHLRYFVAVAAERNFTRAAEKLGIGQPPLSQQIKSLEHELGVTLFVRTPQGADLTRAGEAFLIEARRVLDDAARAAQVAQRAARGEAGQIRIGFTGSAAFNPLVPNLIQRYKQRFPAVDLTLDEANTPLLLQGLAEDRLDAVFFRPGRRETAQAQALPGIALHHFPDEAMKIALPASHPLAARRRLPLSALEHEPFVLVSGPAGATLHDEIVRACAETGFSPRLAQPAPQVSSVVNLVAAGLGVSIVPAAIAQVQVKGVRYLDVTGVHMRARLALGWREQDTSATVREFVALA